MGWDSERLEAAEGNVTDQTSGSEQLNALRGKIDEINFQLLDLLNERAAVALKVAKCKSELGISGFDPVRESAMIERLQARNQGPFSNNHIAALYKNLFQTTLSLMNEHDRRDLLVSRRSCQTDTVIEVNGVRIGEDPAVLVAGPCSVESREQLEVIAAHLADCGVKIMRGGAYKPRTSPYSFQGLGSLGLKILAETAARHHLAVVTELIDVRDLPEVVEYSDIIQIGARSMYNYPLLREVGRISKPVLLKRSFGATLEEFLLSAEYILAQGNRQVILCERGIRTFEGWVRTSFDISAIPLLKQESHLPVMADVSHSAGRSDLIVPLAKAAIGAGADAVMVEVHNNPSLALSDNQQQLDLPGFDKLQQELRRFAK